MQNICHKNYGWALNLPQKLWMSFKSTKIQNFLRRFRRLCVNSATFAFILTCHKKNWEEPCARRSKYKNLVWKKMSTYFLPTFRAWNLVKICRDTEYTFSTQPIQSCNNKWYQTTNRIFFYFPNIDGKQNMFKTRLYLIFVLWGLSVSMEDDV